MYGKVGGTYEMLYRARNVHSVHGTSDISTLEGVCVHNILNGIFLFTPRRKETHSDYNFIGAT